MANVSTPFGLKPVRTQSGSPYSGSFDVFTVPAADATAIYIGDCVTKTSNGTGQTVNGVMYPDCIIAATTDIIDGVVVGVLPDVSTSLPYRAASTLRRLAVCTDPDMLFEAVEANSGTPLALNDVGQNVSITVTAGSAATGLSGSVLDNTTLNTTNTLGFKIVAPVNRPDLAVGLANHWLVRINRHRLNNQIIGV